MQGRRASGVGGETQMSKRNLTRSRVRFVCTLARFGISQSLELWPCYLPAICVPHLPFFIVGLALGCFSHKLTKLPYSIYHTESLVWRISEHLGKCLVSPDSDVWCFAGPLCCALSSSCNDVPDLSLGINHLGFYIR